MHLLLWVPSMLLYLTVNCCCRDQLRLDRLSAQPSSREYLGIDNELTKVENEIEDTECKLTKLQMNLNEVNRVDNT